MEKKPKDAEKEERYKALARGALACEQGGEWFRALRIYNELLEKVEDPELRDKWLKALERVRERAESETVRYTFMTWTPKYKLEDKYEIEKVISITQCNEIYIAKELRHPYDTVVIKRLKPNKIPDQDACARFEREVEVLRRIRHPCVIAHYTYEISGPERYLVIEYANKGTLKEYLSSKSDHRLNSFQALDIAKSVCQGLEAVHNEHIVHRDLKPGNIFLFSRPDGSIKAKLGDFSIAHIPDGLRERALTQTGVFIGTGPYAAPEQLDDTKMAPPQSDLYSWAIMLFEMLTGEAPVEASLKHPVTFRPTADEFPIAFFIEKGIPLQIAKVLQKCLCVNLNRRYRSATEIIKVLDKVKSQLISEVEDALKSGEVYIKSKKWQAAGKTFDKGLTLVGDYTEYPEGHTHKEMFTELWASHFFVQGMLSVINRKWREAIRCFEKLQDITETHLKIEVAAKLVYARSELELEQKYHELLEYRNAKKWYKLYEEAIDVTTSYQGNPDSPTVGELLKLALYSLGRDLLEKRAFQQAYAQFHLLCEEDSNYEDVKELCAEAAYKHSKNLEILANKEQLVKWLEKVIEVDPNYRDGKAQRELDEARHRWVKELLEAGDKCGAVFQLERISSAYDQWNEVCQARLETYNELGQDVFNDRKWGRAIEWWNKALGIMGKVSFVPSGSERILKKRILKAKTRSFIEDYGTLIEVLITVFGILIGCQFIPGLIPPIFQQTPTPSSIVTLTTPTFTLTPTLTKSILSPTLELTSPITLEITLTPVVQSPITPTYTPPCTYSFTFTDPELEDDPACVAPSQTLTQVLQNTGNCTWTKGALLTLLRDQGPKWSWRIAKPLGPGDMYTVTYELPGSLRTKAVPITWFIEGPDIFTHTLVVTACRTATPTPISIPTPTNTPTRSPTPTETPPPTTPPPTTPPPTITTEPPPPITTEPPPPITTEPPPPITTEPPPPITTEPPPPTNTR